MPHLTSLKQVRKNLNLSLQDTAYILGTDVSNLSKYEYGKITPSVRVVIGYHLITRQPLSHIIQTHVADVHATLIERITILLEQIEKEPHTNKALHRKEILQQILVDIKNITMYGR